MKKLLRKLEHEQDSHKGDNGYVGVLAGGTDYTGAPALVAKSALRTGCDLTKILTSKKVKNTVASYSENFIVDSYSSDYFSRKSLAKAENLRDWSDVIVIGPGLGKCEKTAVRQFVEETDIPLVIDADWIEPCLEIEDLSNTVFTPHQTEAEKIKAVHGSIEEFVEKTDAVVLVKGRLDKIYSKSGVSENSTGCASMTVGGTGDVLAGIVGSLCAQDLSREEAARLGAWTNGKAGELADKKYGNGLLATDIIEEIPLVLRN